MESHEVQRILREIGTLMELKGESPFKARAYTGAARVIGRLEKTIDEALLDGSLKKLEGIGPELAREIGTLVETEHLPLHDRLRAGVPEGLLEITSLPGIGPRRARTLLAQLGVDDAASLREACERGEVASVPGFGLRTQERILRELEFRKASAGRWLLPEALGYALPAIDAIRKSKGIDNLWMVGPGRRRAPVIDGIDLLASCEQGGAVGKDLIGRGILTASSEVESGWYVAAGSPGPAVRVRFCPPEELPFALLRFTGSAAHYEGIVSVAREQGKLLDDHGLKNGLRATPCRDEEDIYEALGLRFIPPELREGSGEIEASAGKTLPELVQEADFQGILHVHTDWSDGTASIDEMTDRARRKGYGYIGISDHSRSAFYAKGLKDEAVERQFDVIDHLNASLSGFRVLKGIESDILPDGNLDYPEGLLNRFDFVIGSVHSHFNMDRDRMTGRILKALSHPALDILGHPTGRLLLHRSGYEVDMPRIIRAAAENGVCIELNSNPHRLDLDAQWCRQAKTLGMKIAIGVDAHSPGELEHARFGVWEARRGWLSPGDVLNCLPVQELLAVLHSGRERRTAAEKH